MRIKIDTCVFSMIGQIRDNHEDNFYFFKHSLKEKNTGLEKMLYKTIENDNYPVFGIFDGMGGLPYGEKASRIASLMLKKCVEEESSFSMKEYFKITEERMNHYKGGKVKMGTTASLIRFLEDKIEIGNIGDSRIYFVKGKKLIQVSKDHTEQLLYDELNIILNRKPKLVEYLGTKEEGIKIHPHIKKISYSNIKKIIMCTDGLTDMVDDKEIENILVNEESIVDNMNSLITKVNQNGGRDNTTIMIFKLERE